MIENLKLFVIPELRRMNFKGSFPHFRRITPDRINLLTFQFDRSGGGFVIEIANCHPKGYTTSWGLEISPQKLTAHDVYKRKRIQANMDTTGSAKDDWFRYDKPSQNTANHYIDICRDVLSKLEMAEEYWQLAEMNGN